VSYLRTTTGAAALLAAGLLAGGAGAQYGVIKALGENLADSGDLTGYSVCILDDLDGDGIDDWIVGAPHDEDGGTDSGTAYVVTGGYYSNIIWEIHGTSGDNLGTVVASAGDVNKDGKGDFIVSAPGDDNIIPLQFDVGRVRVYSGATGTVLFTFSGPKAGARLGDAAAGGRDVNADGYPDILCGAGSWDIDPATSNTTNEGYAALYSGKTGALLKSFTGTGGGDTLGYAVSLVGDLDGIKGSEYAIGSPGDDYILGGPFPFLILQGGRVDVYAGSTNTLLFSKLGGTGDELGKGLGAGGDTDGDGVNEMLAGAPGDASDLGAAHLYEGATGTILHTFTGLGYGMPEYFGTSVGLVGDVNKDGHDDVAIGAPMTDNSVYGGYTNLYSGATYDLLVPTLNGSYPGECAGLALSPTTGDLNGDGWVDLLTSWPYNDSEGTSSGIAIGYHFLTFQPNLGFEGPGISYFEMYGTELFSGGQADMRLTYAAGNSQAWLMVSIFQAFSAFKGGILVPNAGNSLLIPFVTDPTGKVVIPGIPGGGGYVIVYSQFLIKNAAYPQGWGLSNALAVELLP
jgi:FG-GAP repeat